MALGANVASAAATGFYSDAGLTTKVDITNVSFQNNSGYDSFAISNTKQDSIKIFFNANSNQWNQHNNQLELGQSLFLTSENGFSMGNGSGKLTLDMWSGSGAPTAARSLALDLANVGDSNYAIWGNLEISGDHNNPGNSYDNKTVNANIGGKGISGDVILNARGTTNFVFSNNATIGGTVYLQKGTTNITSGLTNLSKAVDITAKANTEGGTINFQESNALYKINIIKKDNIGGSPVLTLNFNNGSKMQGNIQTGRYNNGNDFSKNNLVFNGADVGTTVFDGDITSFGTGYGSNLDKTKGNHLTVNGGSIQASINGNGDSANRQGYNKIIMNQAGSKISGSISASGGRNEIVFEKTGELKASVNVYGSSWAFAGFNDITFKKGGILSGNVGATAGNAKNTIIFEEGDSSITGTVKAYSDRSASGGINDIQFKAATTNARIDGNIQAYGGITASQNKIIFESSGTIAGTVTAGTSDVGGGGINTITFKGDDSIVTGNIETNTGGKNIILF